MSSTHRPRQTTRWLGEPLHKIRVKQEDLDAYLERARIAPGALRHLYPDTDGLGKENRTESS